MIVGAVVRQNILLNRALQAGWEFPRYGWGVHPTLGHIEGRPDCTLAYAPSGRMVAVVDTFYDAWDALRQQ